MLPFVQIPPLELGPLTIQPFGVLVAIGVLLGTSMAARYAARYRMSDDTLRFMGMRVVVFGFIMCHLLDVFFYTPDKLAKDPWLILRVWEGLASYGGILGAVIAFTIYSRTKKFHYLRYGDAIVYGFAIGLAFGRAGCSIAHDHLGRPTDFFLGVMVPKDYRMPNGELGGMVVHDLGLYDLILCASIFILLNLIMVYWKNRRPGTLLVAAAFTYAPARFMFDFLRHADTDPRYWGLTPAQHLAIWTVVGGIGILMVQRKPENQDLYESAADAAPEPKEEGDKGATKKTKPKAKVAAKPKAKIVRKKRK